jgi:hypothetical protein
MFTAGIAVMNQPGLDPDSQHGHTATAPSSMLGVAIAVSLTAAACQPTIARQKQSTTNTT